MGTYVDGCGTTVLRVHEATACAGRHCAIHNPSDHGMRDWPTHWRDDIQLMERLCEHGVGHPDPDDVAYKESIGAKYPYSIHGCDGCCSVA